MPAPFEINMPEPPGTQSGAADNTAGYSAKGLASPQPEGYNLNTGGTGEAFGRTKKLKKTINPELQINQLTA